MKKVLFITYFWPPSGKATLHWPLKIIQHLPGYGWQPVVLAASEDTFSERDESLLNKVDPNLKVFKARTLEPFNLYRRFLGKKRDVPLVASEAISLTNRGFKHRFAIWTRMNLFIPDARIGWYWNAVRKGKKILQSEKIEAIISIGPPHSTLLVGKKLSDKYNIPHIPVFIDPWVDITYYRDFKRSKPTVMIDRRLERSVLTQSNNVVFVTESMKEDYVQRYPFLKDKSHVLYWGYNEDAFREDAIDHESSEEILLHAGNIYDYQNPRALWPTLRKEIENGRNLKIVFLGTVSPGIKQSIIDVGLSDRTVFKGFVPYHKMIEELNTASYVMVCATEKRHVPGKIFEYLRSGKPVLAFGSDNEEVRRILDETKAGMIFPYDSNAREFFNSLEKFQTDQDVVSRYDRKIIARKLALILNNTLSK
ncbi:MAG: glycosyltransferase [Bacteroidetes bacterium]|nr:glycosyltransferase [Bacteroidota bacterium]